MRNYDLMDWILIGFGVSCIAFLWFVMVGSVLEILGVIV